jgi:hypothetical protein
VPGAQLAGSSMVAPMGQKLPDEQLMHAVAPVSFWKLPEAQSEHRPSWGALPNDPTAQRVANVEASGQ